MSLAICQSFFSVQAGMKGSVPRLHFSSIVSVLLLSKVNKWSKMHYIFLIGINCALMPKNTLSLFRIGYGLILRNTDPEMLQLHHNWKVRQE